MATEQELKVRFGCFFVFFLFYGSLPSFVPLSFLLLFAFFAFVRFLSLISPLSLAHSSTCLPSFFSFLSSSSFPYSLSSLAFLSAFFHGTREVMECMGLDVGCWSFAAFLSCSPCVCLGSSGAHVLWVAVSPLPTHPPLLQRECGRLLHPPLPSFLALPPTNTNLSPPQALDKAAKAEVDAAVEEAKASPEPLTKDLWTDIYYKGTEPPYMRGREKEEVRFYLGL